MGGNNNLNFCTTSGHRLLSLAIERGHERIWRFLLRKKVKLENGTPVPLIVAVKAWFSHDTGSEKAQLAIEALIDAGANINMIDPFTEKTPLMTLATHWDESCADFLLKRGADRRCWMLEQTLRRSFMR